MKTMDILVPIAIVSMLLYFFIAAQGAFYLFGFSKALYNVPVENFIELRKAVDPVVRGRFKILYLSTLFMMTVWFFSMDKSAGFSSYAFVLLALLLLVTDLVLILKLSEPVNEVINGDILNTTESFNAVRKQWLEAIVVRGYLSVTGLTLLIIHLIVNSR